MNKWWDGLSETGKFCVACVVMEGIALLAVLLGVLFPSLVVK